MPYEVVLLDPAKEFLLGLGEKFRAKAFRAIDLLCYFGPLLRMPHSRKLGDYDLWELRVQQGGMICRLFYFHERGRIYIVTSGYVKKTEKTSPDEIRKALRFKTDYLGGNTL
jgi:phage-related protein